jgi:hypothetical protein
MTQFNALADGEGVSKAELAYRYKSEPSRDNVNALIISTRNQKYLEETLSRNEKRPLSDKACVGVHHVSKV